MIVVSNTTPLNYLIQIDLVDILPKLFDEIIIPEAVLDELKNDAAPEIVRRWTTLLPDWALIRPRCLSAPFPAFEKLGAGEREVLIIALELNADLVLIDEKKAYNVARSLGLNVLRTLGLLQQAANVGAIDFQSAIERLMETSFYADPLLTKRLRSEAQNR